MFDMVQQCALADARLAAQDKHTALTLFRPTDEGKEAIDLLVPTDERAAGGHEHLTSHGRILPP
ncbi:hypothetical protein GCM10010174_48330 [Kutzneria viridogrisea]